MGMNASNKIATFFKYFVLILVGIIMIYPLLWMISATFKDNSEIFAGISLWIKNPTLDGYKNALNNFGGSINILQGLFKVTHKARGAHDDVLPLEAVQIVFAKAQVDAQLPDGGGVIAKVLHALFLVAQSHMSAQLHKLLDEGLVADACADKGDLFALNKLGKLLLIFLHKNSSSSNRIMV